MNPMPIISKSCEVSENENCTNKKLQKFIASFEFETIDTTTFKYRCYIGFKVETNCSVVDVEMKHSNGTCPFDEQVLEHFNNLPEFYKPGFQKGKPIATSYVVPLIYIQE